MPKETVYGCELVSGAEPNVVAVVEVSWARDDHVQLVSKAYNQTPLGNERVAHDDPGIHYTDGFYANLDRRGINHLIRNLRRARDQAFGRDE